MKPFFLEFHVEYESLMFKASISKLYNAQTYADPNEPYFHLHAGLKCRKLNWPRDSFGSRKFNINIVVAEKLSLTHLALFLTKSHNNFKLIICTGCQLIAGTEMIFFAIVKLLMYDNEETL